MRDDTVRDYQVLGQVQAISPTYQHEIACRGYSQVEAVAATSTSKTPTFQTW